MQILTRQIINSIIVFSVVILFFGCNLNRVYEKYIKIEDEIWNVDNKIKFDVNITDSLSINNIYINIRHSSLYPYQNLHLFINTTAPSGATIRDTFECYLADAKGKWYGSGLGDIWDNQILYKRNVRFPNCGMYSFEFEQAMRANKLPFISDIGLRIENVK